MRALNRSAVGKQHALEMAHRLYVKAFSLDAVTETVGLSLEVVTRELTEQ
ncbi:MAG: hypothetical protein JXK93_13570 [Sphaerochaetaceae bacterium]|nr:hypothetical protein [Sphaerochaetaceae bacterium]